MHISKKSALLFSLLGLTVGTAGAIGLQTHAASSTTQNIAPQLNMKMNPPAAVGQVTAVSGNTITLTDKRSNINYTVDISAATLQKVQQPTQAQMQNHEHPTPITIQASDIQVGDNVVVQGTVNGNQITATQVIDGKFMFKSFGRGGHMGMSHGAVGTVQSISGNTITLTGKDGQTYTVNAQGANVEKISQGSLSDISVGQQIMVNGQVSGKNIAAKHIVSGTLEPQN